jgi:hypothetical protein
LGKIELDDGHLAAAESALTPAVDAADPAARTAARMTLAEVLRLRHDVPHAAALLRQLLREAPQPLVGDLPRLIVHRLAACFSELPDRHELRDLMETLPRPLFTELLGDVVQEPGVPPSPTASAAAALIVERFPGHPQMKKAEALLGRR